MRKVARETVLKQKLLTASNLAGVCGGEEVGVQL